MHIYKYSDEEFNDNYKKGKKKKEALKLNY